jgi:hypothetical protein
MLSPVFKHFVILVHNDGEVRSRDCCTEEYKSCIGILVEITACVRM